MPGRFDVDLADLGAQARRFLAIPATTALIVASLMTVAVSAAFVIGPSRQPVAVERESFGRFPPEVGGWQGTRSLIGAETEGVLNADDYVLIDYYSPDERAAVNFWSAFYYTQDRDKGGIHSPEVCLPLDGWNIVSVQPLEVVLDGTRAGSVALNRAVISKGDVRSLVYYWFDGRGRRLASEWHAKIQLKADALTMGRTDGALVRFVTPILSTEADADADARIQRLMAEIIDQLPRFVPE
jgi:EpsI family protein